MKIEGIKNFNRLVKCSQTIDYHTQFIKTHYITSNDFPGVQIVALTMSKRNLLLYRRYVGFVWELVISDNKEVAISTIRKIFEQLGFCGENEMYPNKSLYRTEKKKSQTLFCIIRNFHDVFSMGKLTDYAKSF